MANPVDPERLLYLLSFLDQENMSYDMSNPENMSYRDDPEMSYRDDTVEEYIENMAVEKAKSYQNPLWGHPRPFGDSGTEEGRRSREGDPLGGGEPMKWYSGRGTHSSYRDSTKPYDDRSGWYHESKNPGRWSFGVESGPYQFYPETAPLPGWQKERLLEELGYIPGGPGDPRVRYKNRIRDDYNKQKGKNEFDPFWEPQKWRRRDAEIIEDVMSVPLLEGEKYWGDGFEKHSEALRAVEKRMIERYGEQWRKRQNGEGKKKDK